MLGVFDERKRYLFPRWTPRTVASQATAFGSPKACLEARELPERFGVLCVVQVAETPTGLRQREVRGEIRADDISNTTQRAIRKRV